MNADLVFYDADCAACVTLAGFAERSAAGRFKFQAWGDVQSSAAAGLLTPEMRALPADRLRVWTSAEQVMLEGTSAWAFLVEHHPALKSLNWLAARAGLTTSAPGRVLESTGNLFRRFCRRCPKTPKGARRDLSE